MKLMGHADLNTTSRYVHLSKRHLADAQKKIEQYRAAREIAEAEAAQRVSGTLQGDCGEKRGDRDISAKMQRTWYGCLSLSIKSRHSQHF
jgi:hypothetical protein